MNKHMRNGSLAWALMPLSCFLFGFIVTCLIVTEVATPTANKSSASTDVTATVDDILILTAPESVDLGTLDVVGSVLKTVDVTATVSTNNPTGYELLYSGASTGSCMKHATLVATATCAGLAADRVIQPLASSVAVGGFPVNAWGVGIDPGVPQVFSTYYPVLDTETTLTMSEVNVVDEQTTFRIGAKADLSLVSGFYQGNLTITAVANPRPIPVITAIDPTRGTGGDGLALSGYNFDFLNTLMIGDAPCENLDVMSDTDGSCVVPDGEEVVGVVQLSVMSIFGDTADVDPTFEYVVTGSYVNGMKYLEMELADVDRGSKVLINGLECNTLSYISSSLLTCNTPALPVGKYAVTIQGPPPSVGNMQNYAGCSALSVGDVVVLTDTRNGQDYRIRKMEDNKCWMIDNLKLAGNLSLTSADSNVSALTNINLSAPTTSAYLTTNGTSSTGTNMNYFGYADPSARAACEQGLAMPTKSLTGCGYLYNWYTATAGTGTSSSAANSIAAGSICPSGWRLPRGTMTTNDPNNDGAVLNGAMNGGGPATAYDTSYGRNWWYNGKFEAASPGIYGNSSYDGIGYRGVFWTATVSMSTTYARWFEVSSAGVYVSAGDVANSKYAGVNVRCMQP